eukprot:jgi/Mesvir1/27768/Mv07453-RA.1
MTTAGVGSHSVGRAPWEAGCAASTGWHEGEMSSWRGDVGSKGQLDAVGMSGVPGGADGAIFSADGGRGDGGIGLSFTIQERLGLSAMGCRPEGGGASFAGGGHASGGPSVGGGVASHGHQMACFPPDTMLLFQVFAGAGNRGGPGRSQGPRKKHTGGRMPGRDDGRVDANGGLLPPGAMASTPGTSTLPMPTGGWRHEDGLAGAGDLDVGGHRGGGHLLDSDGEGGWSSDDYDDGVPWDTPEPEELIGWALCPAFSHDRVNTFSNNPGDAGGSRSGAGPCQLAILRLPMLPSLLGGPHGVTGPGSAYANGASQPPAGAFAFRHASLVVNVQLQTVEGHFEQHRKPHEDVPTAFRDANRNETWREGDGTGPSWQIPPAFVPRLPVRAWRLVVRPPPLALLPLAGVSSSGLASPRLVSSYSQGHPSSLSQGGGAYLQDMGDGHRARPFAWGERLVVCVDGARWLPENVTVTKVVVGCFSGRGRRSLSVLGEAFCQVAPPELAGGSEGAGHDAGATGTGQSDAGVGAHSRHGGGGGRYTQDARNPRFDFAVLVPTILWEDPTAVLVAAIVTVPSATVTGQPAEGPLSKDKPSSATSAPTSAGEATAPAQLAAITSAAGGGITSAAVSSASAAVGSTAGAAKGATKGASNDDSAAAAAAASHSRVVGYAVLNLFVDAATGALPRPAPGTLPPGASLEGNLTMADGASYLASSSSREVVETSYHQSAGVPHFHDPAGRGAGEGGTALHSGEREVALNAGHFQLSLLAHAPFPDPYVAVVREARVVAERAADAGLAVGASPPPPWVEGTGSHSGPRASAPGQGTSFTSAGGRWGDHGPMGASGDAGGKPGDESASLFAMNRGEIWEGYGGAPRREGRGQGGGELEGAHAGGGAGGGMRAPPQGRIPCASLLVRILDQRAIIAGPSGGGGSGGAMGVGASSAGASIAGGGGNDSNDTISNNNRSTGTRNNSNGSRNGSSVLVVGGGAGAAVPLAPFSYTRAMRAGYYDTSRCWPSPVDASLFPRALRRVRVDMWGAILAAVTAVQDLDLPVVLRKASADIPALLREIVSASSQSAELDQGGGTGGAKEGAKVGAKGAAKGRAKEGAKEGGKEGGKEAGKGLDASLGESTSSTLSPGDDDSDNATIATADDISQRLGRDISKLLSALLPPVTSLAPAPVPPLDIGTCLDYDPSFGLMVAVDRATNLPEAAPAFAVHSLSPPGVFYRDPPMRMGVRVAWRHDLGSFLSTPQWLDDLSPPQRDTPYHPHLSLVVEVYHFHAPKATPPKFGVEASGTDPDANPPPTMSNLPGMRASSSYDDDGHQGVIGPGDGSAVVPDAASRFPVGDGKKASKGRASLVGWALVPIFITGTRHVATGCFQVPLFAGMVPPALLPTVQQRGYSVVRDALAQGRLRWTTTRASVLVRIVDGQREGHAPVPAGHDETRPGAAGGDLRLSASPRSVQSFTDTRLPEYLHAEAMDKSSKIRLPDMSLTKAARKGRTYRGEYEASIKLASDQSKGLDAEGPFKKRLASVQHLIASFQEAHSIIAAQMMKAQDKYLNNAWQQVLATHTFVAPCDLVLMRLTVYYLKRSNA